MLSREARPDSQAEQASAYPGDALSATTPSATTHYEVRQPTILLSCHMGILPVLNHQCTFLAHIQHCDKLAVLAWDIFGCTARAAFSS